MSKVYCSNCGAEVVIPEHSSVGFGISISQKDTAGTHYIPTKENKNMTKAEQRIATLKANGIDTSNYFAAGDVVIKMENGIPTVVPETDDTVKKIYDAGYVHNNRLDGRFVVAQMFRMLNDRVGYTGALNRYDYNYCLKRMLEEVRILAKLQYTDDKTFREFSKYFSHDVVVTVCEDYMNSLRRYVRGRNVKRCKGREYISIPYYRSYFLDEIDIRLYSPLQSLIFDMKENTYSYNKLYTILVEFVKKAPRLPWNTLKSKAWVDAFKGKGAYMTMKNLIKFHGCRFYLNQNASQSLAQLERLAEECEGEGWRLLGALKEMIYLNEFDFNKRMSEIIL